MRKPILITLSVVFVVVLSFFMFSKKSERVDIVVSIKPIHSLVCALTKGVTTPVLLLDGSVSPHHAQLQPSQVQKLKSAKFVVWIGPVYEQMLTKHVKELQAAVVTLQESSEIKLKPLRNGALWDQHACCNHDHAHYHDHDHHHHDSHGANIDGHIWLSPIMMLCVVDVVLKELQKLYPNHQELLNKNAQAYKERLQLLHQQLLHKMNPSKGSTYIIQHDGNQYFDALYGVKTIATLSIDPNIPPSAGHILKIRKALKKKKIHPKCLYAEKQINVALAKTYADSLKISFAVVDYLGTAIEEGESAYEALMHAYVDEFLKGLK